MSKKRFVFFLNVEEQSHEILKILMNYLRKKILSLSERCRVKTFVSCFSVSVLKAKNMIESKSKLHYLHKCLQLQLLPFCEEHMNVVSCSTYTVFP